MNLEKACRAFIRIYHFYSPPFHYSLSPKYWEQMVFPNIFHDYAFPCWTMFSKWGSKNVECVNGIKLFFSWLLLFMLNIPRHWSSNLKIVWWTAIPSRVSVNLSVHKNHRIKIFQHRFVRIDMVYVGFWNCTCS